MRVVLLGPPGAGKGTLAGLIKNKFKVSHISTGDILREEMKSKSELGNKVKGFVERGELVSDTVVTKIIENRMTKLGDTNKGYLFDGFPRTQAQAKELDKLLEKVQQPIDYVLYMETSLPIIIQRLTGRRVCRNCGAVYHISNRPPKIKNECDLCKGELYQRSDDNEETISNRMEVYLKSTAPIVKYYEKQGKLRKINGDDESEKILKSLTKIL